MSNAALIAFFTAFVVGLVFQVPRLNGCQLEVGDMVEMVARLGPGEVRTIVRVGAWTSNCRVGVRWTDGYSEEIHAWKLTKIYHNED